jgi:hypothetical protein
VVGATLTDFPVALHIGSAVGKLGGRAGSDLSGCIALTASGLTDSQARQIAVTINNGVTECFVEIERWTSGVTLGLLHFKAPTVSPGTNTEFYFYWDNAASDNAKVGPTGSTSAASVWDSSFISVYHMNAAAEGGTLPDSVLFADAVNNGLDIADLIDGPGSNYAYAYGGSQSGNEYSESSTATGITEDEARTSEIVSKIATGEFTNTGAALLMFGGENTATKYVHTFDYGGTGKLRLEVQGNAVLGGTNDYRDSTWHYSAAKVSAGGSLGSTKMRIDGAAKQTAVSSPGGSYATGATYGVNIGRQHSLGSDFYGRSQIAEIRLSSIDRSDSWLDSTYYTLFDTIGFWAATEAYTAAPTTPVTGATPAAGAFGEIAINGSWKSVNSCYIAISAAYKTANRLYISINNQWKLVS